MQLITACQIRAGRAILMWTVPELAQHSGTSEATIRRICRVHGHPVNVTVDTILKIRGCLEAHGIVFVNDGHADGPGVRFRHWNEPEVP